MVWTDKYIGIPFQIGGRDFNGCDCGGLVLLALKTERGVVATDWTDYTQKDFDRSGFAALGTGISSIMGDWVVVDTPRPLDLARFRVGNNLCHAGVVVDSQRFLHVEQNAKFSYIEQFNREPWGTRFVEFRRHAALL